MEEELACSLKFALETSCELRGPEMRGRAMNRIAERLGHELGLTVKSAGLEEAVDKIDQLWLESGLGRLALREGDRGMLEMSDCYDCASWRVGLTTVGCSFKAALLGAALGDVLHSEVRLRETGCCRSGARVCSFRIERN